jgi:hypothetical protein
VVNSAEVLADAFARIRQSVHRVLDGLSGEQLCTRVEGANSIAWLVWHLARIQDDHVADAAEVEQRWTTAGWYQRFGLPFDERATGYGHRDDEVDAVRVESPDLLRDYYDDVHRVTLDYVRGLRDVDLERVVDRSWDPPVTLGIRLISVINDDLQHVGQAALVRGMVTRTA